MGHPVLEHMYKKFEINQTKIKSGCQTGRKVLTYNSKSDLPLHIVKKSKMSEQYRNIVISI